MTDHSITPPPEPRQDWAQKARLLSGDDPVSFAELLCNKSARWGADMELEACCKWLPKLPPWSADDLRKHRRPKPISLQDQALDDLERIAALLMKNNLPCDTGNIRRALESLPE